MTGMLPGDILTYNSYYFAYDSIIVCTGKYVSGGNKLKDVQISFVRDIATVMINARSAF